MSLKTGSAHHQNKTGDSSRHRRLIVLMVAVCKDWPSAVVAVRWDLDLFERLVQFADQVTDRGLGFVAHV